MKLNKHPQQHVGAKPDKSRIVIGTFGDEAVILDTLRGVREVWKRGHDVDCLIIDGQVYKRNGLLEVAQ